MGYFLCMLQSNSVICIFKRPSKMGSPYIELTNECNDRDCDVDTAVRGEYYLCLSAAQSEALHILFLC